MLATTEGLKALVPTIIAGTDALPILDILEILLGVEETVVRTGALAATAGQCTHASGSSSPGPRGPSLLAPRLPP